MPTPEPTAPPRRWPAAVLGVVVSGLLLWWAARGVNFGDVATHLRQAKLVPLLIGVVLATLGFPIRVPRWRLLLRDAGESAGVGVPRAVPLWHAIAVGFMGNNLLPFRAGEVLRVLLATRLTGIGLPAVASSLAIERVLDGLTVLVLLAAGLFGAHLPADLTIGTVNVAKAATSFSVLIVIGLVGAVTLVAKPAFVEGILRKVLPAGRIADGVMALVVGLTAGLAAIRSPSRLAAAFGWSFALWMMNAFAYYIAFQAFDIHVSYAGALLMQGILLIGIAAPSTPGFVGVFEAALTGSLALFAVPNDVALSYAVAFHVLSFIPITLLGLWSVSATSLNLGALRAPPSP
jgi:uncharacterized protein (TIRG00374 family)